MPKQPTPIERPEPADPTRQPAPNVTVRCMSAPAPKAPHHVAIIMDGNGRWAKKRGLPRIVQPAQQKTRHELRPRGKGREPGRAFQV
jgi:hypothetical protein